MPTPTTPAEPIPAGLAKATNTFAFDLWKIAAPDKPGNLAVSPVSIEIALAMTWAGAGTGTSDEMRHVLHLEGDIPTASAGFGKLKTALEDPRRPLKLRIANRLFGEQTFKFKDDYIALTKTAFNAPLEPVSFRADAEASRKHINGWVEDQTEKRIKDLLPPRSITTETTLVLVNAIYFLADWQDKFDPMFTHDAPFRGGSGAQVPTMHKRDALRMAKGTA